MMSKVLKRTVSTFKIYRNNNSRTRMDKFEIDKNIVGPMVLDG